MSNVRAEVLRVSRSRSGWRDGTQKPSSQRPFISALKSTFEADIQKGDVAGTGAMVATATKPDGGGSGIVRSASDGGSGAASGANVKPQRLGGTKVSTIANMFQSLTPSTTPTATTPTSFQQKEYEEPAMSSRPSSKMESAPKRDRREASSPCSSSSSSSSSLTTEKTKSDRGCRDRGDGGVHLNRTESHLARFNNARAMFERLEEESKKSKGPCGWSPAVPKKRSGSMSPSRPSSAISPPQTPRSPSPKRESPLSPREKSRSADCILEDRASSSRICRNGRRQLYDDHDDQHEDELCVRIDHNEESSQSSAQSPVYTSETDSEQRTVNGTVEREEQTSGDGGVISAAASAAECKRSSVSSPQTRSTKIPIPQAAQQLAETNVTVSSSRSKSGEDKMTKSHIPHLQRAPHSPKASARSSVIPDSTVTSAVVVNNVPKVQELVSKGTTTKPASSLREDTEDTVDLNGHGSLEVDTVTSPPLQQNGAKDSKSNGAHWDHQDHGDDDASRIVHLQKEEQEPEEEDLLRITDSSIEVVYADHQTTDRSWNSSTNPLQTSNREGHLVLQARRSWDRTPNTLDLGCFADEGTRVDPEEDEIENTETPALPTPPANGSLREEEKSISAAKDHEGGAAKCSMLQDEDMGNVTSAIIQQANDVPTQTAELGSNTVQPAPPEPPQSNLELASEPEVMTPEEASRLLSRNWRPEFLSDEEASEVTMLLRSQQEAQNEALHLQHQARHQSDSEAGDIEAEPTESYEYEAEFEESVEEAEAEAEGEREGEGEVGEEEEGVHYLDDGHFWVEMPGLIASDEEDVDMFVTTIIRPKKRERVKFSTDPIRVYSTFSVQDYDRRNDDVDPVSASAEYELEKRVEKMDVFPVELVKGPEGLGLSIIGMGVGADAGLEKLGIFVKTITEGGAAFKDERINVNDQIIEVDGKSLVGVTQAYAASVLRNTSGLVRFLIGREKDGENSEVAQLISQSLQADREREERRKALDSPAEASTTTREGGAAGLTLPIPSLSAQLPPASSLAASAVMVQEDMTPEEGEDGPTCEVFDIEDDSSESPSPESDVTSLRIKLKEAQYKNAVAEAELAKAKTKVTMLESMDSEREDYEKKLQSLSVRLVDVERALEAAKKDVMTYQDMLVESQGQYIILEKKYYKAKKLIKEFQQREQDFLHREEYHVQQLQEKDQEYNALVKSLKDRVIQLEQDLMETQRAVGLPVKLPYDNTTIKQLQLTPQQMRKPQAHNQADLE